MKRQTKADRILNQARDRMEIAQQNVQAAETQLGIAVASFNAHAMAYTALERELAPTPRKAAKKAAGSPAAPKEQADKKDSGVLCVANVPLLNVPCGDPADHLIHSPDGFYAGCHPFEGPKPVARASRKSKAKLEANVSTQSIEDATDSAISASSGGD